MTAPPTFRFRRAVTTVLLATTTLLTLCGCPSSNSSDPVCEQPPTGTTPIPDCDDTDTTTAIATAIATAIVTAVATAIATAITIAAAV
ncbi:hypothetical protein AB0M02_28770 [Actinoplanes sp. NPDC051861]|uniref:hypothetical protein n=1 Tax=Actinoplanes sp. NPDC051861 TaxID=3155170 RepID=UPI00341FD275